MVPHTEWRYLQVVDPSDVYRQSVRHLVPPAGGGHGMDRAQLERRRADVGAWLVKNGLPVDDGLEEEEDLVVAGGVVTVQPPYDAGSCLATNEIVLDRVSKLLTALPSGQ